MTGWDIVSREVQRLCFSPELPRSLSANVLPGRGTSHFEMIECHRSKIGGLALL